MSTATIAVSDLRVQATNRPTPIRPAPHKPVLRRLETALAATLTASIRAYRLVLSPLLGPRCRHLPTCSEYALDALTIHGPWRGVSLTVRRLLRCHPWGTSGYDPVPPRTQ